MALDPSFSITYGDLKFGKTADLLAAFGDRAVYVAAPGALSPAESVWGFPQPKIHDLATFRDIRDFGEKDLKPGGPVIALAIDDATLIADRTANYYADVKKLTGWDLWRAVVASAVKMRDSLRRRGIHVAMTCHAGAPYVEQGVRMRGGPSFQGQTRKKLPAAADLLLRAEPRPGAGFGWPYVYRTAPHADWLQGSRYDTPDYSPLNLGEILRLAGFKLPRLKGLEWQEGFAEQLAAKLTAAPGITDQTYVKDTLSKARDVALARFTKTEAHAMWAVRDGYDRAVLRHAKSAQRASLWGF